MSRWIDFSENERKAMIFEVADIKGIDEVAAEKDWWVTATLFAAFHTDAASYLLFKGGTSLSKGWGIIDRFSEDCDLALDKDFFLVEKHCPFAKAENNTQLHKLREIGQDYILGRFKDELSAKFIEMGLNVEVVGENEIKDDEGNAHKIAHDKDPSVIFVRYPSLFVTKGKYAQPVVKVEISILSMREPYEIKQIRSLVEDRFPNSDSGCSIDIKTVSPARTFLEKAFLLCEEYQKQKPRTFRMSRHFYDLEKLSHTQYADIAMNDSNLYLDILAHRRKFYHVGYVDYDTELPGCITIFPPEKLLDAFREDYEGMLKNFIYGETLSFDALMESIKSLQNRLRNIPRL